jgi:hypothetical protein
MPLRSSACRARDARTVRTVEVVSDMAMARRSRAQKMSIWVSLIWPTPQSAF